jgi:hypothetical protein
MKISTPTPAIRSLKQRISTPAPSPRGVQTLVVSNINPCTSNFDQTVELYEIPSPWLEKHKPDTGVAQCAGVILDVPFYDHKLDFNHTGTFTTPHDAQYWYEYAVNYTDYEGNNEIMAYCNEYYPNHEEDLDNIAMCGYMHWLRNYLWQLCIAGWTNTMW